MRIRNLLAGLTIVASTIATAYAGPAYTFTGSGNLSGPGDFAQATTVLTNSAITIDQIGVFAMAGVLAQNHGFRIRDVTHGVDLFNGIINAGTGTLINGFRYIDISNIAVAAGVQLAIMSDNRSGNNTDLMDYGLTGLTFDPALTLVGSSFQNVTTVATFPLGSAFGLDVLAGANLLLVGNAVPEPATLGLAGLALLGLVASRKRKAA